MAPASWLQTWHTGHPDCLAAWRSAGTRVQSPAPRASGSCLRNRSCRCDRLQALAQPWFARCPQVPAAQRRRDPCGHGQGQGPKAGPPRVLVEGRWEVGVSGAPWKRSGLSHEDKSEPPTPAPWFPGVIPDPTRKRRQGGEAACRWVQGRCPQDSSPRVGPTGSAAHLGPWWLRARTLPPVRAPSLPMRAHAPAGQPWGSGRPDSLLPAGSAAGGLSPTGHVPSPIPAGQAPASGRGGAEDRGERCLEDTLVTCPAPTESGSCGETRWCQPSPRREPGAWDAWIQGWEPGAGTGGPGAGAAVSRAAGGRGRLLGLQVAREGGGQRPGAGWAWRVGLPHPLVRVTPRQLRSVPASALRTLVPNHPEWASCA